MTSILGAAVRRTVCVCTVLAVVLSARSALAADGVLPVRDQLGRLVALEQPAERIVTIPMPAAPMLIGLQQGVGSLAAMHPESRSAIRAGVLGELFPAALSLPTNVVGRGFMPNVEAVLATKPDLVIQWGNRGSDLIAPLEAAGLPVAAVQYGGEEDIREWLSLFGVLTGEQANAKRLIAARHEALERLAPLRRLPDAEKPRVLYLFRVLSGLQVAGGDTFNDFSIRSAGGRNAAADLQGFKPVNREQILAWNPEVILLNSFEPGLTPAHITDDPVLGLTAAAAAGRVYQMPIGGYRWDPPSHESPLAWLWLAARLHPERLDVDLSAQISAQLTAIYGEKLAPAMIARVLGPENAGQSGDSAAHE